MNRVKDLVKTINHWDFWVGITSGVAVGFFWRCIQFKPDASVVTALITLVIGTLAFIETTKMSLYDKLFESEYGVIVRKTDPRQQSVMIMYIVGRYVSLSAAALGVAAVIVTNTINNVRWQSLFVGVATASIVWMVMIFVSLKNWQDYFMGEIARLRSLRERMDREDSMKQVGKGSPPSIDA